MSDHIIIIDCAGTPFKTSVSTLGKVKYFESYLDRWNQNSDPIFVDEDPEIFKHFLNLSRNPHYVIPDNLSENVEILADYYGLAIEPVTIPDKKLQLHVQEFRHKYYSINHKEFNFELGPIQSILDIRLVELNRLV